MTYRKDFAQLLQGALPPDHSTTKVYGLSIPTQAAGFVAESPIDNEKEVPGLGTTIQYVDTNNVSTVAVYVYNHGVTHIPDGMSEVLREEAAKADKDVRGVQPHAEVWSKATEGITHDIPYVFYGYNFPKLEDNQRAWVSYLTLMAHKNHFIKVRMTRGDFASIYMSEGGALMVMQRLEDFMERLAISLKSS